MSIQPLLVHILFHPKSEAAREVARSLHTALNQDPVVPGLRVPTVFCGFNADQRPPSDMCRTHAERNVVLVLADAEMDADNDWCGFVGDLWEQSTGGGDRFIPFQLTPDAWPLDLRMNEVNFARAYLHEEEKQLPWVIRRTVVELCRYLSNLESVENGDFKAPTTLFLSHTKVDHDHTSQATTKIIDCLKTDQPLEAWVDSGDIPTGSEFAKAIDQGVRSSSLLAVLTDSYATREWCREEILLAKEHQRPVVVVDALEASEARSFPYLGNVPRIRWDDDPQAGIDLLLKETLRHLHESAVLANQAQPTDEVFARAPELATLVGRDPAITILYPDPPVGIGERRRLERSGIPFTTPLERLSSKRPLDGRSVGVVHVGEHRHRRVRDGSAPPRRCDDRGIPLSPHPGCNPCVRRALGG